MRQNPVQPRQHPSSRTQLGTPAYLSMVEKEFKVVMMTGDEAMCFCPWHENTGTPSLQVNVRSGMFVCFNPDCGARGGPRKLSRHCGVRFSDPEVDVTEIFARLNALAEQAGQEPYHAEPIPETMLRRYSFPTDYWDGRGLTKLTQAAFDLGYDPVNNFATIAIRSVEGELVGFIRRDLSPNPSIKYRNPKHYKKARELFASWMAIHSRTDELVICEGPLDAIKVWQAGFCAVAQYGAMISSEQVRLIRRMGFGRIVLFYDNDRDGKRAVQVATGKRTHLRNDQKIIEYDPTIDLTRDFLVSQADYTGISCKDPGDMNQLEIVTAIAGAVPVM